jgi:DNA-binding MarR family transcriptional regulator
VVEKIRACFFSDSLKHFVALIRTTTSNWGFFMQNMTNHMNEFYQMPKEIMRSNLIPSHKLVLTYIYDLSRKRGYCWATNNKIACETGIDVRNIKNIISGLRKQEIIETSEIYDSRANRTQRRIRIISIPEIEEICESEADNASTADNAITEKLINTDNALSATDNTSTDTDNALSATDNTSTPYNNIDKNSYNSIHKNRKPEHLDRMHVQSNSSFDESVLDNFLEDVCRDEKQVNYTLDIDKQPTAPRKIATRELDDAWYACTERNENDIASYKAIIKYQDAGIYGQPNTNPQQEMCIHLDSNELPNLSIKNYTYMITNWKSGFRQIFLQEHKKLVNQIAFYFTNDNETELYKFV